MREQKFIYRIFNFANCKSYIGSTKFPNLRFRQHMNLLKRGVHPNKELQSDYNLYGDVFSYSIIDTKTKFRNESEEYSWMRRFRTYDEHYGYNSHDSAMRHMAKNTQKPIEFFVED